MKNIRIYCPKKYSEQNYKKVRENIYEAIITPNEPNNTLVLKDVKDDNLLKKLRNMDNWKKCENEEDDGMLYVIYNDKKYYKDVNYDNETIFESDTDYYNQPVYVTSIVFEQEPEYGENKPSDRYVSQNPLEDILEKFNCYCYDEYIEENAKDPINSYVEFASNDIKDIEKVLTIVGKHVYNKEEGKYIKLIIE